MADTRLLRMSPEEMSIEQSRMSTIRSLTDQKRQWILDQIQYIKSQSQHPSENGVLLPAVEHVLAVSRGWTSIELTEEQADTNVKLALAQLRLLERSHEDEYHLEDYMNAFGGCANCHTSFVLHGQLDRG